jgi:hypothetical protein
MFTSKAKKAKDDQDVLDDNKKTRSLPKKLDLFVTIALTPLGFHHIYVGFFGARSTMELRLSTG